MIKIDVTHLASGSNRVTTSKEFRRPFSAIRDFNVVQSQRPLLGLMPQRSNCSCPPKPVWEVFLGFFKQLKSNEVGPASKQITHLGIQKSFSQRVQLSPFGPLALRHRAALIRLVGTLELRQVAGGLAGGEVDRLEDLLVPQPFSLGKMGRTGPIKNGSVMICLYQFIDLVG